jgi:hypothetical protein
MTTVKTTLLVLLLLGFSALSFGQTNNPKKNYFGTGLTSRFQTLKQGEVKSKELAEVLNLAELLSKKSNDSFDCKVFSCHNGPSDPELEYCNESINYYISNGKYDLPYEFKLFKIGPFYTVEKAALTTSSKDNAFLLTIHHKYDKEKWITQYLIDFEKITLVRRK